MTRDEAVREAVEKAGALEVAIPYGRLVQMETAARHAYSAGYAAAREDAVEACRQLELEYRGTCGFAFTIAKDALAALEAK